MLTLRTLKELIDTPKRGEKLPTPKQLRTGESPVVAHKTTGAGVNEVHIIVYQSGYAVYGIGNRATVFPVNLELGYGYSSVTEKKRKEDEKYNTWNPETGLREKKYFCELEESFFEKEEWYLRLMLIGEDRLAHNLATRDRGRCISFNGISEDFEGMEDELMDVEERVNRQQIAEEMMSVLSDKQKKVVQEFYWNQKTHKQIAKENGVKRNAVTEILKYALNKMDDNKGTSVILIHSSKGEQVFNAIKTQLNYKEMELDIALPPSADSRKSVLPHPKREKFFKELDEKDIVELSKLIKTSLFTRIKRKLRKILIRK